METSNIEFMMLSLEAVVIVITVPAMPAGNPAEALGSGGRLRGSRRVVPRGTGGKLPPPEGVPVEEPATGPPKTTKGEAKAPTTGTRGDKGASARPAATQEKPPAAPLPANQQAIRDALLNEHPGLHPEVAADAAKGGARAMGKGGAGADVPLLNGGGREVSVHSGAFTPGSVGSHLQAEAMQRGTTEIYLQINSGGRDA